MQPGWVIGVGMLALSAGAGAEDGRYQAFQLSGAENGKSGARALILDSRDGHVWVWSENELVAAPDGARRYSTGFIYQGKLRPGSRPGEMVELQSK